VPPFRGGTWQAFYAGGGHCQPVTRRPSPLCQVPSAKSPLPSPPQASPSTRSPRDAGLPRKPLRCLNDGTCGRNHADSCAGVTPYCSLWAVGYDISCGGLILICPTVRRKRPGVLSAPGEG
jgi:hypothetical protein